MSISDVDGKTASMAVMGSLLAFLFYGRIQDASDIVMLKEKVQQGENERRDWWGKWNDKIVVDQDNMFKMADFMINDAKEKALITENIMKVELDNANEWKEYYKDKISDK